MFVSHNCIDTFFNKADLEVADILMTLLQVFVSLCLEKLEEEHTTPRQNKTLFYLSQNLGPRLAMSELTCLHSSIRLFLQSVNKKMGAAAYQLGNTSSRTITEVKQC